MDDWFLIEENKNENKNTHLKGKTTTYESHRFEWGFFYVSLAFLLIAIEFQMRLMKRINEQYHNSESDKWCFDKNNKPVSFGLFVFMAMHKL